MDIGALLDLFIPLLNVTTLTKPPFQIFYLKHTYTKQENLSTILVCILVMVMMRPLSM